MCIHTRGIHFASFYDFDIGFQNCSDSVVIQNCSDSVVIQNCSDSVVIQNCSDSVVFQNCSDSVVFFVFHLLTTYEITARFTKWRSKIKHENLFDDVFSQYDIQGRKFNRIKQNSVFISLNCIFLFCLNWITAIELSSAGLTLWINGSSTGYKTDLTCCGTRKTIRN